MKICTKCGIQKGLEDFFVKDKKTGRLHAQCKACYRMYRDGYYRLHYAKKKSEYLERAKKYRLAARNEFRTNMLTYLAGKACCLCGEADLRTFEFDHIDPSTKLFSISQAVRLGYKWDQVIDEIKKCRILCANCHKKHTAEQYGWYKF